jgi:hypothetical protein
VKRRERLRREPQLATREVTRYAVHDPCHVGRRYDSRRGGLCTSNRAQLTHCSARQLTDIAKRLRNLASRSCGRLPFARGGHAGEYGAAAIVERGARGAHALGAAE